MCLPLRHDLRSYHVGLIVDENPYQSSGGDDMTKPEKDEGESSETRVSDLPPTAEKAGEVKGGRQTPKMDFGDRMKAGLEPAAGVVPPTTP
jgi:hypothetical protein